jgi:hypothetical protein
MIKVIHKKHKFQLSLHSRCIIYRVYSFQAAFIRVDRRRSRTDHYLYRSICVIFIMYILKRKKNFYAISILRLVFIISFFGLLDSKFFEFQPQNAHTHTHTNEESQLLDDSAYKWPNKAMTTCSRSCSSATRA